MPAGVTLSGTVRDSRSPAPVTGGATVRLDTGSTTTTDADGRFETEAPQGTVTVTDSGRHHGFETETVTIDQDRVLDFALEHSGDHPDWEDVAESTLPWYAARKRSERLPPCQRF